MGILGAVMAFRITRTGYVVKMVASNFWAYFTSVKAFSSYATRLFHRDVIIFKYSRLHDDRLLLVLSIIQNKWTLLRVFLPAWNCSSTNLRTASNVMVINPSVSESVRTCSRYTMNNKTFIATQMLMHNGEFIIQLTCRFFAH